MEIITLLTHPLPDVTRVRPSSVYAVHAIQDEKTVSCILGNTHVGYVAQLEGAPARKGARSTEFWGFTEQPEDFATADFIYSTAQAAAEALREQQHNVIVYSVN